MWKQILTITIGSALGALLRWQLANKINTWFPDIPPGTLASNLIGGYIVGIAVAGFSSAPNITPEWRLFIITGFCGGLTTFSTFSAEIVTLLQAGKIMLSLAAITLHLGGSLLMTIAGFASWHGVQALYSKLG